MRSFYYLLANNIVSNTVNSTVWFAIVFFTYLQTQSVLATSIISGIYLVSVSITGFIFGGIVDANKKKNVMIASNLISLSFYAVCFIIYTSVNISEFSIISSPTLWAFVLLIMSGVIAGNLRSIALPTVVTIMIPEERRDKANGLVGMTGGIAFLVTSVFSGLLVAGSGMYLVLLLAIILSILTIVHLLTITIPEHTIVSSKDEQGNDNKVGKLDIRGTIKSIRSVDGLLALILFTTFNNFLGGVYMSLLDPYGLSLVSVEVWGLLFGFLSTAFIFGGIIISKYGLGKKPLRSLFRANIIIWIVSIFFTIQPSVILLIVGMFIYLAAVPFIEAAEHTIIQKVVDPARQGRVFGFAQSIEQAASPLTAFLIGPIAQFIFIPFMTDGKGAELIGSWFGTGTARGIALVFILTGIIGLIVTILASRMKFYRQLSFTYKSHNSDSEVIEV